MGSLLHLLEPPTCPNHEPDQSSQCPPPHHFLKIHFKISAWVFQAVSFPQVSSPRSRMNLSSPPHVLHALPIILLDLITQIYDEYRSYSVSLCHLPHSPNTSCPVGRNMFLSILLLNIPSLYSLLTVGDQLSHPYKTKDKIIVPYIWTFIFLGSKLEDKRF